MWLCMGQNHIWRQSSPSEACLKPPPGEKLVKWCILENNRTQATNTGSWNSFRQRGSQAGSKLKSIQLAGRQTEPVLRRGNNKTEGERRERNEGSCGEEWEFSLVTQQNKPDWQLVQTGQTCLHLQSWPCRGWVKLNSWWCGSRKESCWGTCWFASTHTQMLTMMTAEHPVPFSALSYLTVSTSI